MRLNRTPNPLDRDARNGENDNWEKIEGSIKRIDDTVSDLVLESGGDSNLEVVQARGGKRVLNERLNEIDSRLAEKASKTEVNDKLNDISVTQINKNKGKLDASYMSEEFLQQMAGNTPIGSVPEDGSVTPKKTTFARNSKNLFNKDDITLGKTLGSQGQLIDDSSRVVSGFIPVEGGQTVARSHLAYIAAYDENKNYLQLTGNSSQPYYLINATHYIRVSFLRGFLEDYQLEYGDERTSYEEHGKVIIKDLQSDYRNLSKDIVSDILNTKDQVVYNSSIKKHIYPNKIIDLVGSNETNNNVSSFNLTSCSVVIDNSIKWKQKGYSYKITSDGSQTSQVFFNLDSPINIEHSSAVGLWVFVEDYTNIDRIHVDLYTNEQMNEYWTRHSEQAHGFNFKKGWNLIRWDVSAGASGDWKKIYRIRIRVTNSGENTINVAHLFTEKNDKARLIIVNDGARKSWLNVAYPELKARNFPTTWAVNPNTLGSTEDKMTEEELLSLITDLDSSFSFHSWGSGTPTAQMTEKETREDALRCIRWLKHKGLAADYLWRAAVHQNQAPHHRVNDDLLLASATHTGLTGFTSLAFPFTAPYNIERGILHGDNPDYDRLFNLMDKIRGVTVVYTHGITDEASGSADMTTAQWQDFLSRIDNAVSEGWLEGATFEGLFGEIANSRRVNELEQLSIATRL